MKLFGKKKVEDPIDDRTPLEKSIEEKAQKIGKKAGSLAQKGLNKVQDVKGQLEESGTIDKVKTATNKVAKKTDELFTKAEEKVSEAVENVKTKIKKEDEE
jgi:hypothetical protein